MSGASKVPLQLYEGLSLVWGRENQHLYLAMRVQVRHPNILALKDTMEVEDKGLTTLYIITEPVTPLAEILKEREIEGPARWVCACWGETCSWPGALLCGCSNVVCAS